jgi:hypothetical protein
MTATSLDDRVAQHRATDADRAEYVCAHWANLKEPDYFMRHPRTGATWFLCRDCCRRNLELADLINPQPPGASPP